MAPSHEDDFDHDLSDEELEDEFDALFKAFNQHVEEFAREHDVPDGLLSVLTQRTSLTLRMAGYVTSVENPSGAGLKLDLDRFRRELDDAIRAAKKGADEFVAMAKAAMAEEEAAPDEKPK